MAIPVLKLKDENGNIYNIPAIRGAQGEQGEQGVGIDSISTGSLVQSNEYTVTPLNISLTNGTTVTVYLYARNGEINNGDICTLTTIQTISGDKTFTGDVVFTGDVDFSNANVVGVGFKKTKITLSQLQTMLTNYTLHRGKIIQLVAKGSAIVNETQQLGLFTIEYKNSVQRSAGNTTASQSALYGNSITLFINASSAYFTTSSWDFDIANGTTNTNAATIEITDNNCDIYIWGE